MGPHPGPSSSATADKGRYRVGSRLPEPHGTRKRVPVMAMDAGRWVTTGVGEDVKDVKDPGGAVNFGIFWNFWRAGASRP
jgi:hypothetical protein